MRMRQAREEGERGQACLPLLTLKMQEGPRAKGHMWPPEAGNSQEQTLPWSVQKELGPANPSVFSQETCPDRWPL